MDVLPGNRRVLAMILSHWPDAAVGHSPDGLDIHITLPSADSIREHDHSTVGSRHGHRRAAP